jgi:hypothetical protein
MQLSNPDESVLYDRIEFISFTGTRNGITKSQAKSVRWLFKQFRSAQWFLHGDCLGADEQVADIALDFGLACRSYPCTLEDQRAYHGGSEVYADPKPPLVRNKDIVNAGDCLVACPKSMNEELRSGTWATVRYARGRDALIWTVWPDGALD